MATHYHNLHILEAVNVAYYIFLNNPNLQIYELLGQLQNAIDLNKSYTTLERRLV